VTALFAVEIARLVVATPYAAHRVSVGVSANIVLMKPKTSRMVDGSIDDVVMMHDGGIDDMVMVHVD